MVKRYEVQFYWSSLAGQANVKLAVSGKEGKLLSFAVACAKAGFGPKATARSVTKDGYA
jgi:hypothetical protein